MIRFIICFYRCFFFKKKKKLSHFQILIELRSLGLDSNARVRQKVMEVMSFLILLYDRINGMLGIRVIIGGLGDPDADVVLASLEGLERMKVSKKFEKKNVSDKNNRIL
jgi:hypothetical protein